VGKKIKQLKEELQTNTCHIAGAYYQKRINWINFSKYCDI